MNMAHFFLESIISVAAQMVIGASADIGKSERCTSQLHIASTFANSGAANVNTAASGRCDQFV